MVPSIVRAFWFAGVVLLLCALQLCAQPAQTTFEVASIREHTTPLHTIMGFAISGSRISLEGYTLRQLVIEAYGLKGMWQLSMARTAGTGDDGDIYYDLAARTAGDREPSRKEVREMLQTLLAERFRLIVHRESKELPVYALNIDKGGLRLKDGDVDGKCGVHVSPVPNAQKYLFVNCHVSSLVDMLGNGIVDRPVIDRTGLAGAYSFSMAVTPAFMRRNDSDAPELSGFSAVQDLGLKLVPDKAPIEVIAIDHFEKPSGN